MSSEDHYDYARHRYIWDAAGSRIPLTIERVDELPSNETIAHSLSQICRWTGHTREFYSVAQHCLIASLMVPEEWALEALLHDAAECLTGDVSSPLKRELDSRRLREMGACFDVALAARERLVHPACEHPLVKKADVLLARLEARDLLGIEHESLSRHYGVGCGARDGDEVRMLARIAPARIVPVGPKTAERWWLKRYKELRRKA